MSDVADFGNERAKRGIGAGGGPPDGGNVNERIAAVEARLDYLATKEDVATMIGRFDRLVERVDTLPTKAFIVTVVVMTLSVVAALVVFQAQIQAYVGTLPSVK